MSNDTFSLEDNVTIHLILHKDASLDNAKAAIQQFAGNHDLTADDHRLTGKYKDIENALGIKFYKDEHIKYQGEVTIPSYLKEHVLTVFNLTNEPAFKRIRPKLKPQDVDSGSSYLTPIDVAKKYNFPSNGGKGQKIGIIELGGGYNLYVVQAYLSAIGINSYPSITDVYIDGAFNNPADIDSSGEVYLDIEIAAAIAYESTITVYFTPNSNLGFRDAIQRAIQDGNNAISISWAGSESAYSAADIQAFENTLSTAHNTVIYVSSGDAGATNGSSDGSFSVNYPSSSQYVVGVGGTSFAVGQETAWNDGGGGFSSLFAIPSYQSHRPSNYKQQLPLTGAISETSPSNRGVPDWSANADPDSGYIVTTDTSTSIVGGTSAAAPLLAAFNVLLNVALGKNISNILTHIYDSRNTGIRRVNQGNNGGYFASDLWNPCTGVGSLDGQLFLEYLKQTNMA